MYNPTIMKGFNKDRMSAYNRISVMRAFYSKEIIAIHSLAKEMQLAIPTISNIVNELNEAGYIQQADTERSSRGRHRGYWTLNKEKEHFITMEVSPYEIKGIIVDASGKPKSTIFRLQEKFANADSLLKGCIQLIKKMKKESVIPIQRCALGIHGIVNYDEGISILLPRIYEKKETPFKSLLEEATGCLVKIDNDCNTKALAEKWLGAAQNIENFIWLNLDYGVGAALVLSGELFRGNKYTAGQIGHVSFSTNGPLCSCGNQGCLEMYFSSKILVSKFRMAWENSAYEQKRPSSGLDINDFFSTLQENHPIAVGVFHENVEYLGKALVALVNIVSPEHVFMGGELCHFGAPLLNYLRDYLKESSIYRGHDAQELAFSPLEEESLLAGGAFLWLEEELAPK